LIELTPVERAAIRDWFTSAAEPGCGSFDRVVVAIWTARRSDVDPDEYLAAIKANTAELTPALPVMTNDDFIAAALSNMNVILGFLEALHTNRQLFPLTAMDFFGLGFGVGRNTNARHAHEVIARVAEVVAGQVTMLPSEAEYRVGMAPAGEQAIAEMISVARERRSKERAAAGRILAELLT
jgi:hypothetical protein